MAELSPRPLNQREGETLDFVLSIDDPRVEPLRAQAGTAMVSGMCHCGCATIDLAVDGTFTPADLPSPAIGADPADAGAAADESFSLLLFLDGGRLASLEVVYYGSVIPSEFPPPSAFGRPRLRHR